MKYLKLFNKFESRSGVFEGYQSELEVAEICKKYTIENWSLVDGLVNVDGDVILYDRALKDLPLKFGTVTGSFDCSWNRLTSLVGCPIRVGEDFSCTMNKLTSLVGCPLSVGEDFSCGYNNIREFTGIKYTGGRLRCNGNPIHDIWKVISPNGDCDEDQMDLFEDLSVIQDDGEAVAIERLNFFLEEIGRKPVEKLDGYINI